MLVIAVFITVFMLQMCQKVILSMNYSKIFIVQCCKLNIVFHKEAKMSFQSIFVLELNKVMILKLLKWHAECISWIGL